MRCQPVACGKCSARPQHPEDIGKQRLLVGDVNERILGKHHVETGVSKWQWPRFPAHEPRPFIEPLLFRPSRRQIDDRLLDVETGNLGRSIFARQEQRDAARAAADVENPLAGKVEAVDDPANLVRPPG